MRIERSIVISRPADEVFAFLLDARNDPQWCPKVVSVALVEGDVPGPGARYAVVHKPVPGRPARNMDFRCLSAEPHTQISWREDDGHDVIDVTYLLEEVDGGTRLTQRDDAQLGAPRLLQPFMKLGIGHDIAGQLKRLKVVLKG